MIFKLIINPHAGNASDKLISILRFFRERGHIVDVHKTKCTGDGITAAKRCKQYDCVIAAGGDGTVNEVVNGLMGQNVPLGILPIGTANVLAIELGIPLNLENALIRIEKMNVRAIDVGKAGSRYFTLCCGVGLDAQIVKSVSLPYFKRLKKAAFIANALKEGLLYDGSLIFARVNGKKISGNMMIVSNATRYAGDLILARQAKIDDGYLTITMYEDIGIVKTLTALILGAAGKVMLPSSPQVKVKKVRITSENPVLVHADAEIIGTTPITISIVEKGLKIVV